METSETFTSTAITPSNSSKTSPPNRDKRSRSVAELSLSETAAVVETLSELSAPLSPEQKKTRDELRFLQISSLLTFYSKLEYFDTENKGDLVERLTC